MKLPLDIRDLMTSGAKLRTEREKPIRIAVFVDVDAPDELVNAVQAALHPATSGARLHVEACAAGEALLVDDASDAVVAITGSGTTLARSLASARDRFVPTVALALGERAEAVSSRLAHPLLDTHAGEDAETVVRALGVWLADRVSAKRLALAANFAFTRRAVAEESVKATAFQNGIIGTVAIIPGTDMPLMTANQAKMVLQIAAAYGETLGAERIKELAVVVGGGFAFRSVARQALAFIPGFGWAVKGAIGYSGTLAMGYAAVEYFERGGDVSGLADKLRDARDRAVEVAGKARGRLGGTRPDALPAAPATLPEESEL